MTGYTRACLRLVVGPLLVAAFAGAELSRLGAFVAAAAAYFIFVIAQVAVDLWVRLQLRVAGRRYRVRRSRWASRRRRQ